MKKVVLAAVIVLLAGCDFHKKNNTPEVEVAPDLPRSSETLYRCTYKYDSKFDLTFAESKRVEFRPVAFPDLLVYHIIDVKGKKWSINQYDWKNYTCIPTIQ